MNYEYIKQLITQGINIIPLNPEKTPKKSWKEYQDKKVVTIIESQKTYINEIDPDPWNKSGMWNSEKYKKTKDVIKIPPNIKDVKEYCILRNNNIDPEKWYSYYDSKGWMIGKDKMKDWKRAIITWEVNQKKPYIVNKLADSTIEEITDELKKRGWTGKIDPPSGTIQF